MNLYQTIAIPLPDGSELELLPPSRNSKNFRPLLIELQSIWVRNDFDVYQTVADDRAWALMQEIINLLPQKLNPAERGINLEKYSNQYGLLRWLFLQQEDVLPVGEAMGSFVGAKVLELCEIRSLPVFLAAIDMASQDTAPVAEAPKAVEVVHA